MSCRHLPFYPSVQMFSSTHHSPSGSNQAIFKNIVDGGMDQQLRAPTALAPDPSSVPKTHFGQITTTVTPAPKDPAPSSGLYMHCTHMCIPTQTHIHLIWEHSEFFWQIICVCVYICISVYLCLCVWMSVCMCRSQIDCLPQPPYILKQGLSVDSRLMYIAV